MQWMPHLQLAELRTLWKADVAALGDQSDLEGCAV